MARAGSDYDRGVQQAALELQLPEFSQHLKNFFSFVHPLALWSLLYKEAVVFAVPRRLDTAAAGDRLLEERIVQGGRISGGDRALGSGSAKLDGV